MYIHVYIYIYMHIYIHAPRSLSSLTRRLFQGILRAQFRVCSRPSGGYLEVIWEVFWGRLNGKNNLQPGRYQKHGCVLLQNYLVST